jgi:hypothetical protein
MSEFDTYLTGLQQAYRRLVERNQELESKLASQPPPTVEVAAGAQTVQVPLAVPDLPETSESTRRSRRKVEVHLSSKNDTKLDTVSVAKTQPQPQPAPPRDTQTTTTPVLTQQYLEEPKDSDSLMSIELYPASLKHGDYLLDSDTGDYYTLDTATGQVAEPPAGHLKKITIREALYYQDSRDDRFYEVTADDGVGPVRGQIQTKNGKKRAYFDNQ